MFQHLFLEGVVGFDFLIPGKERDMRQGTGDCITEITAETVHHGSGHNQGNDPEGNSADGDPGDHRNRTITAGGKQIAFPDKKFVTHLRK